MKGTKMDIDDLTLKQARELVTLFAGQRGKSHSLRVGDTIFIRTVTLYYTGRVESVTDADIVLEDAAWIGNTVRWAKTLSTGELDEVEPYPGKCVVSRNAIVDWSPWGHPLPREVK
jgi:hypothetical protein